jgi:hypothetical protein
MIAKLNSTSLSERRLRVRFVAVMLMPRNSSVSHNRGCATFRNVFIVVNCSVVLSLAALLSVSFPVIVLYVYTFYTFCNTNVLSALEVAPKNRRRTSDVPQLAKRARNAEHHARTHRVRGFGSYCTRLSGFANECSHRLGYLIVELLDCGQGH